MSLTIKYSIFSIVFLLGGCAAINSPLLTVNELPDNQLNISSEAPLNSTTRSTALMEAEAARRCPQGYSVLSNNTVATTDGESIELIVECDSKLAVAQDKLLDDQEANSNEKEITVEADKPKGNDKVRLAQKTLNELGYNAGRVDGFLGEDTSTAIKLFQEESGLLVTGRLDINTQEVLNIR